MILNRLGKKTKIAHEIYPFFKPHNGSKVAAFALVGNLSIIGFILSFLKYIFMSQLLQFFSYSHLPAHLQKISKPFSDFVNEISKRSFLDFISEINDLLPSNFEKEACLLKLEAARNSEFKSDSQYRLILEAKDCAVRSFLLK